MTLRKTPLLVVLLLVGLAGVLTYVFPFRQIIAQQRAVEQAQRKLELLREESARLEGRVEALRSPTEVERMAREQFGLVRPGELAYVVVSPPEEFASREEEPGEEAEEPAEPPLPAWWEPVWDFLTGRDLVPDG